MDDSDSDVAIRAEEDSATTGRDALANSELMRVPDGVAEMDGLPDTALETASASAVRDCESELTTVGADGADVLTS